MFEISDEVSDKMILQGLIYYRHIAYTHSQFNYAPRHYIFYDNFLPFPFEMIAWYKLTEVNFKAHVNVYIVRQLYYIQSGFSAIKTTKILIKLLDLLNRN